MSNIALYESATYNLLPYHLFLVQNRPEKDTSTLATVVDN